MKTYKDIEWWYPNISKQPYYIGNCIEGMKKIPDKSIDLIVTDPPYGINIARNGTVGVGVKAKLKDYGRQTWDSKPPSKTYFTEMLRISKLAIIFGGNYFTDKLPPSKCWLCWDKKIPKNFKKAQIELCWTNSKSYSRTYTVLWNGMIRDKSGTDKERYHPTQKPVKLIKMILEDFSNENDVVLDPFLGSGTTLRACKELNRIGLGFEIAPEYEKIIRKRAMLDCDLNKYME